MSSAGSDHRPPSDRPHLLARDTKNPLPTRQAHRLAMQASSEARQNIYGPILLLDSRSMQSHRLSSAALLNQCTAIHGTLKRRGLLTAVCHLGPVVNLQGLAYPHGQTCARLQPPLREESHCIER